MSVTVRVPPPWRNLLGDRREVDLEGATVREVLGNLIAAYPELKDRVYDGDGRLNSAVAVFVNQDSIGRLSGLDTPVADGDRIVILMAIAGG
jgi:molybdopterin converting factor small subunit